MSMINKCTILNWIFSGFLLLIEERVFDKKVTTHQGGRPHHSPVLTFVTTFDTF